MIKYDENYAGKPPVGQLIRVLETQTQKVWAAESQVCVCFS